MLIIELVIFILILLVFVFPSIKKRANIKHSFELPRHTFKNNFSFFPEKKSTMFVYIYKSLILIALKK